MSYVNGQLVAPRKRNLEAGNVGEPCKRMNHSAAILGNIMFIYGGIFGEENEILSDYCAYDIGIRTWIQIKQPKTNKDAVLGPRVYHTMDVYVNKSQYPNTHFSNSESILSSRLLWLPPIVSDSTSYVDLNLGRF